MRKILGIARYTYIEIFRNKVYYVLLLFAGLLMASTLLLGALGGQEGGRMMIDLGLVGIETFALIIAVFAAVTLVLEEMESRTLYLILTRPVGRYQFILGRFVGLIALISTAIVLMAAAHLSILKWVHVSYDSTYGISLYFAWEKIVLVTAVAMVFSLFSTSTLSAVTFTLFFWVMGHLSGQISYVATQTTSHLITLGCRIFYYVVPNFEVMNLIDFVPSKVPGHWLWAAAGYGFSYTAACLALTTLLFQKKEF